jgi:hypothetical protein
MVGKRMIGNGRINLHLLMTLNKPIKIFTTNIEYVLNLPVPEERITDPSFMMLDNYKNINLL